MSSSKSRPAPSSDYISRKMSGQRQRDTNPEMEIRRILHARGYRYRVDYRIPTTRRRSDIAFPGCKVAVFIDGCFWHSCPQHGTIPKSNSEWWESKLNANVQRDRDTDHRLESAGWTVIRVWEHEDANAASGGIAAAVSNSKSS
jgi:DNA mismatch endonuclease (patch repair protein)